MLRSLLERTIKVGRLTVRMPGGRTIEVGRPPTDEPRLDVGVRLDSLSTAVKLAVNPELCLGEAYTSGALALEQGSLWDLLDLLGRNLALRPSPDNTLARRLWRPLERRLQQANSLGAARRNVAHHYDLSDALYRTFLDEDLQYSCAYFRHPGLSLDEAQQAKIQHIAAKLRLAPGQRVLDIGCGWGGLALSIARAEEVCVTGITLSREQLAVCRERAKRLGLEHKVSFELLDYRKISGQYDRIVSVGMFEHVGSPNYPAFFRTVRDHLTEDGVALIHSIGCKGEPGATNPWIRKYIFPGGYTPSLSEVTGAIEQTGLWVADLEILRLHYAQTLKAWREKVIANADHIRSLYDDRFLRMWEFYLAGSEMGFRHLGLMVFQAQLAKRVDSIPITRDYMFEAEAQMRSEAGAVAADTALRRELGSASQGQGVELGRKLQAVRDLGG